MLSLGLDVGGANTKATLLRDGKIVKFWFEYIPLWKEKWKLGEFLKAVASSSSPAAVGATLTGELCDVFGSKREGVNEITEMICGAFGDGCLFISLDGELLTRERSLAFPQKLAAANWVASSLVIGRRFENCLLIDAGSTTTDLIPIEKGKPLGLGKSDFQRLKTGELVYTGALRTPLSSICKEIRIGQERVGIAAENFATMADVYRVIGMIDEKGYTCETSDGKGKDERSCMQRIARVFCSDLDELGEKIVLEAGEKFRRKQLGHVVRAIRRVLGTYGLTKGKAIVTGFGRKILAHPAARMVGFEEIVDLADIYGEEAALMTPAFCVGLLAAEARGWTR